jgi:hypothetical protein
MNKLDPDNIVPNVQLTVQLPRVVTALDYHEFASIQTVIQDDLGLEGVYVTEVGFCNGEYVALIHTDCESHNQLVLQLENYYMALPE